MVNANALKIAASTLAVGVAFSTGMHGAQPLRAASQGVQVEMMQIASGHAAIARKAIAAKKGKLAVDNAERAVAAMPQDASYRLLLGEAYLSAGRFASAETSFNDALVLDGQLGRAALKLALSQAAQGKNADATQVLEEHRENMNVADYGLALTLAGDPGTAIPVLTSAARAADATPKLRQNLAFAHAMAGNWTAARTIAGQDLQQDMVAKRIMEWAALSRPQSAADQVAGILGVKAAVDAGQPIALALNSGATTPSALAVAEAPVSETQIAAATPAVTVAVEEAVEEPKPVAVAEAVAPAPVAQAATAQAIVFGPRSEIVQAIPSKNREPGLIRAASGPAKQMVVPTAQKVSANGTRTVESGRFAVQLGAYSSPKRAEQGWNRITGRIGNLRGLDPQTARVKIKSASLYRLSVTGFGSRDDAADVCTKVRAAGGECFIRAIAGDAPLRWALRTPVGGTRLAAARR